MSSLTNQSGNRNHAGSSTSLRRLRQSASSSWGSLQPVHLLVPVGLTALLLLSFGSRGLFFQELLLGSFIVMIVLFMRANDLPADKSA